MSSDPRKEFLFATIANYFGINSNDKTITELQRSKQVNSFLDDGNQSVLVSIFQNGTQVQLYNDLQSNSPDEQCIIFFKLKPEAVTPDNIHSNVLVSSMFKSPASTLYHTIKNIFGPLILNGDVSSKSVDPKLQKLLSELEAGLGSYLRKSGDFLGNNKKNGEQDFSSILTPSDEFQFWSDLADKGDARAINFKELFERCKKNILNFLCIIYFFIYFFLSLTVNILPIKDFFNKPVLIFFQPTLVKTFLTLILWNWWTH